MRKLMFLMAMLALGTGTPACGDDEYKWHFDPVCGNGAVDEGEECDAPSLGGASCELFGFTGGVLECTLQCTFNTTGCTGGCTDACTEGVARCQSSGDAIESCIMGDNLCTSWVTVACEDPDPFCVTLDGAPMCNDSSCAPVCTLGARRCSEDGTSRMMCMEDTQGCPEWDSIPCPEETPVCALVDDIFSCNAM